MAITRRELIGGAAALPLLRPHVARAQNPPNIVLVVLDDMAAPDWRGLPLTRAALGDGLGEWPNCITTTPVCTPARATLLTGQYARRHGVLSNGASKGGGFPTYADRHLGRTALNTRLQDAGYTTGLFGKFLNEYEGTALVPIGWDRWRAFETGPDRYWDYWVSEDGRRREEKRQYVDDYVADQAVAFVSETAGPWFAYVGFRAPHYPSVGPERYRDWYADAERPRTPAFQSTDLCGKPEIVLQHDERQTDAEYDLEERGRLRTLAAVDEGLARLIATLADTGQLANTVIMLVADNGWSAGDHQWWDKSLAYDRIVRGPLWAAGPGIPAGRHDALIGQIDIAPTLAAIGGTTMVAPDGVDIRGGQAHDAILIENHYRTGIPATPEYSAVRTLDHLYVRWRDGFEELYDYQADLWERDNLLAPRCAGTPAVDPVVVDALRARRVALREASPAARALPLAEKGVQGQRRRQRQQRRRRRRERRGKN